MSHFSQGPGMSLSPNPPVHEAWIGCGSSQPLPIPNITPGGGFGESLSTTKDKDERIERTSHHPGSLPGKLVIVARMDLGWQPDRETCMTISIPPAATMRIIKMPYM